MSEEDLKPFDWDEYKAGAEAYVIVECHVTGDRTIWPAEVVKTENREGEFYYEETVNGEHEYSEFSIELFVMKQINKERIGSSFDDFMKEEYIQE